MTERTVLGERLHARRRLKGLTQKELGDIVRISAQTIARIEQGRAPQILTGVLERLSLVLEVSTDYLLGLSDDPRPRRSTDQESEDLMAAPPV